MMLSPETKSRDADALAKGVGSVVVIQAESLEAAWALVKADVYWDKGVVRVSALSH